MTQAYQIPDPQSDCDDPRYLVISPQSIRIEHSARGLMAEAFTPELAEVNLQRLSCPNPECSCPDDYYLQLSVKIPEEEYMRLRSQPGWYNITEESEDPE